jgi:hypothetical protein
MGLAADSRDCLSDEALLDLDRTELIEAAKTLYDEELAQRNLTPEADGPREQTNGVLPLEQGDDGDEAKGVTEVDSGVQLNWLKDAVCVCSFGT